MMGKTAHLPAADPSMALDHRAVPLETLREFARDESERSSLRQVAAAVGVGRTTLQNFIQAETSPHPRVKRLVALWYLKQTTRSEEEESAEAYATALDLLVGALPVERRGEARRTLIEIVERVHGLLGVPLPAGLLAVKERLSPTA